MGRGKKQQFFDDMEAITKENCTDALALQPLRQLGLQL